MDKSNTNDATNERSTIVYRAGLKTARRILARVQVTSIILVRLPRVAHELLDLRVLQVGEGQHRDALDREEHLRAGQGC